MMMRAGRNIQLPCGQRCRARAHQRSRRSVVPRAEAGDPTASFDLAPSKPSTPYGEMMAYYLKMEPRLFDDAVASQFEKLQKEREAAQQSSEEQATSSDDGQADSTSSGLVLSGLNERIQDVAASERRATVEDLMYMCILQEFMKLGVGMLPKMDNYTALDAVSLKPMMEGVHTKEAIELVREHMMNLLGQTVMLPPTATLKMSKLQMVQVYGASVMFGYFLRRADKRFQLARKMGMLPEDKEDAVARLERLFSMADTDSDDLDRASPPPGSTESSEPSAFDTSSEASESAKQPEKGKPALRKYIETFDQQTMRDTAMIMSREGASLLDRQTKALWGDVQELQAEMQKTIGTEATSLEEVMKKAEKAVETDAVATVTMSIATQRRAVLEAVAFGTFMRDVETDVDSNYGLLTPLRALGGGDSPPQGGPPGMLPA